MSITVPDVYSIIVEMSNINDPLNTWRNTFDVYSANPFDSTDPINTAIVDFMQGMIHAADQVTKLSCYNKVFGAQPYPSGNPIYVISLGNTGLADTVWYPPMVTPYVAVGKEVAWRVDHQPTTGGKPGRNFYRRFFGNEDVYGSEAGNWSLSVGKTMSQYNVVLANHLSTTGLNAYLSPGAAAKKLVVVRHSKRPGAPPPSYSVIEEFNGVAVTTCKTTRKSKK